MQLYVLEKTEYLGTNLLKSVLLPLKLVYMFYTWCKYSEL